MEALPRAEEDPESITVKMERVEQIEERGEDALPGTSQGRAVRIAIRDEYVAVLVDQILSFHLWFAARHIECSALHSTPDSVVRYWLLKQVLPIHLLMEGKTEFLHGMAVSSFHSSAGRMAFLGQSYAGKSTLLHYFLSRGHALVTDDHLALSRKDYTRVFPSFAYYRPYRAEEDLGVLAERYTPDPTVLQQLYLLEPAKADAEVRLEPVSGLEAVSTLFSFALHKLPDIKLMDQSSLLEERFRGLAEIARRVPMARLHVPRSLDRLPEVYAFLEANVAC